MYKNQCAGTFLFYLLILISEAAPDMIRPRNPAHEFSEYIMVQPWLYHGRTKRAITSTNETTGEHYAKVTMEVAIDGEMLTLDLTRNMELLAKDHVIAFQRNGKTVLHKPTPEELEVCQYNGVIRGRVGSWAAVSTCRGVRGLFHDGKKLRYIEPEGATIDSPHFIYDHSKLAIGNSTETTRKRLKRYNHGENRFDEEKYQYTSPSMRPEYNGKQRSLYIELVAVVDNRVYRKNRSDLRLIHQYVKDLMHAVSSLLAPLNIFVILVGVKVWSERDEVYLSSIAHDTLDAFLDYRFQKLTTGIPNDHALLLTKQSFKENIVGKAYQRQICTRGKSGSVAKLHSDILGIMAATVAHEIGHNLGMNHDTDSCKCEGEVCVMAPSLSDSHVPVLWSSCSLDSLAYSLQRGVDYCLRNIPDRLFDSPICGNGLLEGGEQCDCGMAVGQQRAMCEACCHAETCLLRSNASCATGSCCDVQTCQLKPVATVCRAATTECDLTEYCTGKSEFCPEDVKKMDTTPCDHNEAYCVGGKCRSHNSQCRLLWGQSGVNGHESCYKINNEKCNEIDNCGYDLFKKTCTSCIKGSALCGRLQCRHFNSEVEFGASVIKSRVMLQIIKDKITSCATAVIDTGVDEDPGMVPDGAKCGENKICMNHRCVDVQRLRERIVSENSVCPSDCSQHGVCNSRGNCHCDGGFAPPTCQMPGAGGSVDSGPASDPNILTTFMIAMYVIFLGILPLIILLLLLACYLNRRRNAKHGTDLNHLKVQNCTSAEFSQFNNITKSSEKKTENIVIDKPNLKKEDIKVIRNCDATAKPNNGKRSPLETMKISSGESNENCGTASIYVDTPSTDYVNMNRAPQSISAVLIHTKNINFKTKTNNVAESSISEYVIPFNCKLSKKSPALSQESSNNLSVQELRKVFSGSK